MNPTELRPAAGRAPRAGRRPRVPGIRGPHSGARDPSAMMAVVGTLGYNFQVILPLLARFSFDGGAATYTAAGGRDGAPARSPEPS